MNNSKFKSLTNDKLITIIGGNTLSNWSRDFIWGLCDGFTGRRRRGRR